MQNLVKDELGGSKEDAGGVSHEGEGVGFTMDLDFFNTL